MLVWHVDYNSYIWAQNTVNNNASHQYVDLEEADNIRSDYTRAGDAFPGTSKVTSFTDTTTPSMKTWTGAKLNLPITDITETDGIITFNVAGGDINAGIGTADVRIAPAVSVIGCDIVVRGASGLVVTVTTADGRTVYNAPATSQTFIRVSAGLYIVRVGDTVVKTVVG